MTLSSAAGKVLLSVLSVLLWAACVAAQDETAPTRPKAIVLAWDGAVPTFIREMLRDRKLPNLAKLMNGGAFAEDVMPAFPSLTAPGFASLWTGAPPRVTGISGNRLPRLPRSQFTILDSVVGFNPTLLHAEPLWAAAERGGRKAVVAYAPLGGGKSEDAVHFQAYAGVGGRDGVIARKTAKMERAENWKNVPESLAPAIDVGFTIAGTSFFGLLIDDPADVQIGYDTFIIAGSRDGEDRRVKLKAAAPGPGSELFWSGPVDVQTGTGRSAICYFRLFDLKPDGSDFLLYFTRPTRPTIIARPEILDQTSPTIRAFVGNGANVMYGQGAFGATIPQGGDGTAETRYLDTVMFLQHQVIETSRWALAQLPWDLFFAYTPYPDEAEHLWRGYVAADGAASRPEVAARLRPFLERVYEKADEFLGVLMDLRPDNTLLALVSDHGMESTDKLLAINKALQRAELLKLDEKGHVDLAATKAIYPSFSGGYLLINSIDRKSGIVAPDERDGVVRRIREALLGIHDGDRQVVTALYDAEADGAALGIGGETGGDLYVDVLPGYELDARLGAADLISKRDPHGMHGFNPSRSSMRTLMVLNGPGIKADHKITDVRVIDLAPTLAKLLGIPAPRDSWGRVLEEAWVDPN
jgi:predicted AlkP superfamily phosphohydrolase/phosphomutase